MRAHADIPDAEVIVYEDTSRCYFLDKESEVIKSIQGFFE
jgi:hypothetical protein